MITYSIADLENLTGIKAHTIRIWEKRYNVIEPSRTATNIRYYSNDDMRKLINISALMNAGMKISKISKLSPTELNEEVNRRLSAGTEEDVIAESYISQLINAGLDFNEASFDKLFSSSILKYGIKDSYIKILIPVLNRIGLLWSTESLNPAQEHFISNLVKQKLYSAIDALPPADTNQAPVVLFLPDFEDHEIGLLMANFMLRQAGRNVIYLGQKVPLVNIKDTVLECNPSQLLFFLIQTRPTDFLQNFVDQLSSEFTSLKIFLTGNKSLIDSLSLPKNMHAISDPEILVEIMKVS
ncbi:MAG: MerR family transcriptional regulator [Bacteroidales bacterium]|jgi:DNA-binding transcriptional MerR regulator|nr:MerR family transcriptional regulator [Bacteroidales bacterium]